MDAFVALLLPQRTKATAKATIPPLARQPVYCFAIQTKVGVAATNRRKGQKILAEGVREEVGFVRAPWNGKLKSGGHIIGGSRIRFFFF
jgi:hypothetical protein